MVFGKFVAEGVVFEVVNNSTAIELIKLGKAFAVSESTPATQVVKKEDK